MSPTSTSRTLSRDRPKQMPLGEPEAVAQAAERFLSAALEKIVHASNAGATADAVRVLFPHGVELIRLTFQIGSEINISLTIAGEKAPQEPKLLESVRDGENGGVSFG